MDRGPHGWAEEVRSQPEAQRRGVFSPSARPCPAARLCGQPVGPGSDSGRSPLCGLLAHSTWGWGTAVLRSRGWGTALQAAPRSFPGPPWAAEKPLRSPLTSLGLTISWPSATQPSNPADGASPPETLRGALRPRGRKLSAQGGRSARPRSARLTPPASGQRGPGRAGPGLTSWSGAPLWQEPERSFQRPLPRPRGNYVMSFNMGVRGVSP